MRIVEVTAVTPELVESIGRLIPQLSTSAAIPTADQLEARCRRRRPTANRTRPEPGKPDRRHPDPGPVPNPHRCPGLDRGRGGRRVGSKARSRRTPLPRRHRTSPVRRRPQLWISPHGPHAKPPTASTGASVSHCGRPTSTATRWNKTTRPHPNEPSRRERRLSCRRLGPATFLSPSSCGPCEAPQNDSRIPPLCSQRSPASIIPASAAPKDPWPFIHS